MTILKRKLPVAVLAAAAMTLTACGGDTTEDGASGSDTNIVFATSSQGSDAYVAAVSMADLVKKQTDVNVTVQSVGGSEASLRAIGEGHAQMALGNR